MRPIIANKKFYNVQTDVLTLSSSHPLDSDVPDGEHAGVVVHVQEGHLVVFLTQHEENCVQHFYTLREVEPPQCFCHLWYDMSSILSFYGKIKYEW